ncbi:MAG: argininosuccinate lyase [Oscillospiraceae bacterium]|nr:argininosuccinate lyase [Oscillospiraceae bacterium]
MRLWGGRFSEKSDSEADKFHSSLSFDRRLYRHDIIGSIAHAKMLGKQGIITKNDADAIAAALTDILTEIESGGLTIDTDAEDIHSFVEAELISRIGDAGRRLHTGRSRNDQVALDMRMYVKDEISSLQALILHLLETLLDTAQEHIDSIMPGYTHLQKAQPVTLGHHLMAYVQMFRRDFERLSDCRKRTDVMPLGSGALASTTYPLDRECVKETLRFDAISENSLDAVSDRDFCVEYLSCLSIVMMHLSRFCEELILWSSGEFGFVEISDSYATGSSIMPQKKNPDMAELIRGKTGRVYGSLMGLLTVMKGLPLTYNKDMQEDKESVFDASDTVSSCLFVFTRMLKSIVFHTDVMAKSTRTGFMNATDAADWLVRGGVPFRDAHEIIGKLVLYAIKKQASLEELSLDEFKAVSDIFDETIYQSIAIETCVKARSLPGGPSRDALSQAIESAKCWVSQNLAVSG